MNLPKVSVCVITYNHELYIREALNSIISQKTNFDFEIIISNDASTDKTETIIKEEYLNKYKNIIYLNTSKRLGVTKNWVKCLSTATGKYVAIIEGDDYWTRDDKLQKQYDLMEAYPEYSFCFHKLEMKFEREHDIDHYLNQDIDQREFTLEDIITRKWFIGTCSIFYRRQYLNNFPKWINGLPSIDKPVQLLLASKGKIGFIDEFMGIYRIHNAGISQIQWLGKERIFEKAQIKTLKRFNKFSKYAYYNTIYTKIYKLYNALLEKNKKYYKDYYLIKFDFLMFRLKKYILTKL